jgi:hypothetical protein
MMNLLLFYLKNILTKKNKEVLNLQPESTYNMDVCEDQHQIIIIDEQEIDN